MKLKQVVEQHQAEFWSAMTKLREDNTLVDVTLVCEQEEFFVHKTHLAASSRYFLAMFRSGMKETSNCRIELNGISAQGMHAVLGFLYSGTLPDTTDEATLEDLLHVTDFLQIQFLFSHVYQVWKDIQRSSPGRSASLLHQWEVAEKYNDTRLVAWIIRQIAFYFENVSATTQFQKLSVARLGEMLSHPAFIVGCSDSVLAGILRWVRFSEEERKPQLEQLLLSEMVDLKTLSRLYLDEVLQTETLIRENPTVRAQLSSTQSHLKAVATPPLLVTFQLASHNELKLFDVASRKYLPSQKMPLPVSPRYVFLTGYQSHLYFSGPPVSVDPAGQTYLRNGVYRYSPFTGNLQNLGKWLLPTIFAGVAALDNMLYVTGVRLFKKTNNSRALRKVQRFNLETNVCDLMADTIRRYRKLTVCPVGMFVYVIGIEEGDDSSLERYNPILDEWTEIELFREALTYCLDAFYPVMYDGCLVVGGNDSSVLNVYDADLDAWQERKMYGDGNGDNANLAVTGLWSFASGDGRRSTLFVKNASGVLLMYEGGGGDGAWTEIPGFFKDAVLRHDLPFLALI